MFTYHRTFKIERIGDMFKILLVKEKGLDTSFCDGLYTSLRDAQQAIDAANIPEYIIERRKTEGHFSIICFSCRHVFPFTGLTDKYYVRCKACNELIVYCDEFKR